MSSHERAVKTQIKAPPDGERTKGAYRQEENVSEVGSNGFI